MGHHNEALAPYLPEPGAVTVLSAEWCGHCKQLKSMLQHEQIAFREVMIETDSVAEEIAAEANGGSWLIPTVITATGQVLVHPRIKSVKAALGA